MKTIFDSSTKLFVRLQAHTCRFRKIIKKILKLEKTVYVWSRVPFYREMWRDAAEKLGAGFEELGEGIWEIRNRENVVRTYIHNVQLDDPVTLNIAGNKPFCYSQMKKSGLPVPEYIAFNVNEIGRAKAFMQKYGGYFVVKPGVGTGAGMGVTTHIRSYLEFLAAVGLASNYGNELIIEKLVPGECYRILILDGRVIHASRRRGMRVKGDGVSPVWSIAGKESLGANKNSLRAFMRRFRSDRDVTATLGAQGLTTESVPEAGKEILVKSFANSSRSNMEVRTVYDEDATKLICRHVLDQAVQAARVMKAVFVGVDIITLDPSVPLEACGGVINEINTTPGLHHHYDLVGNEGTPAAEIVLDYLLQNGRN